MQFAIQYRIEDLAEAFARVHAPLPTKSPQADRANFLKLTISLTAFVAASTTLVLLLQHSATLTPPTAAAAAAAALGPPHRPTINLFDALVPGLVPAAIATTLVLFIAYTAYRSTGRHRNTDELRRENARTGPALLLALLASTLPLLLLLDAFRIDWTPTSRLSPVLVTFAPWPFPLLTLIIALAVLRRLRVRQAWAAHASFHRPKTATIDDTGIAFTDPHGHHLYRWPALVRFRETPNLFLITTEDKLLILLPKRALPTDADLTALYALLHTHIPDGHFLPQPHAYPVLPLPAPAPEPQPVPWSNPPAPVRASPPPLPTPGTPGESQGEGQRQN